MLEVYLTDFRKPKNSTRRPAAFRQGDKYEGLIKGDFTPMSPEIVFKFSNAANMPTYNYAYIPEFKRYYFIDAWAFVGGLWAASMVVDVAASFRDEIKRQRQYFHRSQSHPNPKIIDTTYLIEGAPTVTGQTIAAQRLWGTGLWSGIVVAGIVGASGQNVGAVTYYAMTYAAFNTLLTNMLSGVSWMGISAAEVSDELQKAIINPTQYIVSSFWLPFQLSDIPGNLTASIKLGWWSFNVGGNAKVISDVTTVITRQYDIPLLDHPRAQSEPTLKYLNLSPYRMLSLKFLPFGVFDLDSSYFYDASHVMLMITVSASTGDAVLSVAKKVDGVSWLTPAFVTECNIGVQLPTGQISANIGNYKEALTAGLVSGAADIISAIETSTGG